MIEKKYFFFFEKFNKKLSKLPYPKLPYLTSIIGNSQGEYLRTNPYA
jgi:hypothetical protein